MSSSPETPDLTDEQRALLDAIGLRPRTVDEHADEAMAVVDDRTDKEWSTKLARLDAARQPDSYAWPSWRLAFGVVAVAVVILVMIGAFR